MLKVFTSRRGEDKTNNVHIALCHCNKQCYHCSGWQMKGSLGINIHISLKPKWPPLIGYSFPTIQAYKPKWPPLISSLYWLILGLFF